MLFLLFTALEKFLKGGLQTLFFSFNMAMGLSLFSVHSTFALSSRILTSSTSKKPYSWSYVNGFAWKVKEKT